jgi:hypothetical protein
MHEDVTSYNRQRFVPNVEVQCAIVMSAHWARPLDHD